MTNISDFLKPSVQNKKTLAAYCLMVFLVATPSAILIVGLTNHWLTSFGLYDAAWFSRSKNEVTGVDILGGGFFGPIAETLLLGWFLDVLSKHISNSFFIALAAATVFASLHAFTSIYWFFGPLWLFFLMSYAYMVWRPHSYGYAFTAACIPHMLNNLTGMLLLKFM